jgi:PPK2 family polyphosphate:nucleotide phosphotransferase
MTAKTKVRDVAGPNCEKLSAGERAVPKRLDLDPYRAATNGRFRLRDHRPDFLPAGATREKAAALLADLSERIRDHQEHLYAHDRWSLLLILQGLDAAGKDSAIEHVFEGVNPQACQVHAFKIPSEEEIDHDFLWRTNRHLPRRGHIGIFNRSYYEEVLVVRVHPELLGRQRLPQSLVTDRIWRQRFDDIVAHERHLSRNGTMVRKIFLHLSKAEQRRRLLARLEDPQKLWKFSAGDIEERRLWQDYQHAYDEAIRYTTTTDAPWYVVPADRKWWARVVIGAVIVDALERMDLRYPALSDAERRDLERIKRRLQRSSL